MARKKASKRAADSVDRGVARRKKGPIGRAIEVGDFDLERDAERHRQQGVWVDGDALVIHKHMVGAAQFLPALRFVDSDSGDCLLEVSWASADEVRFIDHRSGRGIAGLRVEFLDGTPVPVFVLLDGTADPADAAAEVEAKLRILRLSLADRGEALPDVVRSSSKDRDRLRVLDKREQLERDLRRNVTAVEVARETHLPERTVQRYLREAPSRFNAEERGMSREEEIARLDAEGRRDDATTQWGHDSRFRDSDTGDGFDDE